MKKNTSDSTSKVGCGCQRLEEGAMLGGEKAGGPRPAWLAHPRRLTYSRASSVSESVLWRGRGSPRLISLRHVPCPYPVRPPRLDRAAFCRESSTGSCYSRDTRFIRPEILVLWVYSSCLTLLPSTRLAPYCQSNAPTPRS